MQNSDLAATSTIISYLQVIYHYHVLLEHLPPTLVASMLTEEAAEAANKDVKVGLF